ncbi:MAG: hydroxyacylglutathione hydrolase [Pelagibacteraceae bacterium]|nr:hydroxyacylglutathione hydrolase [Pelagibacteraceae bacterium]
MQKPNIYIFPQLTDNYGYLIKNPHENEGAIIDPSDLEMCEKILKLNDCSLTYILLTHHHDDHISAVSDLKKKYNCTVIGNESDELLPSLDLKVKTDQEISILNSKYRIISTPGHTMQHICYYNKDHHLLFAGDTLFSVGCGRMFEGTPEFFWESLSKIKLLDNKTLIYFGHEYTQSNVKFALSIDPNNSDLIEYGKWVERQYLDSRPTVPASLESELKINPFLRCDNSYFKNFFKSTNPVEIFKKMRAAKDTF